MRPEQRQADAARFTHRLGHPLLDGGEDITDFVELGIYFYPKGQEPKYRQHLVRMGRTATARSTFRRTRCSPPTSIPAEAGGAHRELPAAHAPARQGDVARGDPPDRADGVLSHVGDFTFNWHYAYVYADDAAPLLPKGTVIKVTAWHDNTAANKANPDPNVWVGYGDRTVDEMAHAWVNVTYLSDEDYLAEVAARRAQLPRAARAGRTHGASTSAALRSRGGSSWLGGGARAAQQASCAAAARAARCNR